MAAKNSKDKFYQRKKTIDGVEYTAQYSGASLGMRMADECRIDNDHSNMSLVKLSKFVLEHAIVDPPHLTIEDFDDKGIDVLNEVVAFGTEVLMGRFREEDTSAAEASGQE